MLRPFLIVGVGGSGGATLRAAKEGIRLKLNEVGYKGGIPKAWQFLHFDSVTVQDGAQFPAPFLEGTEFVSLVSKGTDYSMVCNKILSESQVDENRIDLQRIIVDPKLVDIEISRGAGQYRGIGRVISLSRLQAIRAAVSTATKQITDNLEELRTFGKFINEEVEDSPEILIVSSIAGGSGAGMFIDVAEAVKAGAKEKFPTAVSQMSSILFTPDVFSGIGDSYQANIAPNSLFSVSEVTSTMWRDSPSAVTESVYNQNGFNLGHADNYRMGTKHNFLVGDGNSSITFGSQYGVYQAAGSLLTALVTSPKLQEQYTNYFKTNQTPISNNSSLAVEDASAAEREPFSALGFSRLSLGMEKFEEYAVERLAKQALRTILEKHTLDSQAERLQSADQDIEESVTKNYESFRSRSGIYPLGVEPDHASRHAVFQALKLNVDEPIKTQLEKIQLRIGPKSGRPVASGVFDRLLRNEIGESKNRLNSEFENLVNKEIRRWTVQISTQIESLVTLSIAGYGAPVTVKMLEKLVHETSSAVEESKRFRQVRPNFMDRSLNFPDSVTAESASLGYQFAGAVLGSDFNGIREQKVEEILDDLLQNFLRPLIKSLGQDTRALLQSTNNAKLADTRDNLYKSWPDFDTAEVSKRFDSAPNEAILFDKEEFPETFDSLVRATFNEFAGNPKLEVIGEIIQGDFSTKIAELALPESDKWTPLRLEQRWTPVKPEYQDRPTPGGSTAKYSLESNHMNYLNFARKWTQIADRPFGKSIRQSLVSYLDSEQDPSQYAKRKTKFVERFDSLATRCAPFAAIDIQMLQLVHNLSEAPNKTYFSDIPFSLNTDIGLEIKNILISKKIWTDDSVGETWFKGQADGSNVRSIEFFSYQRPLQPLVISSLMEPVKNIWASAKSTRSKRSGFLKWRRARPLNEGIPAQEKVWQKMLNGFFVAKYLNQINLISNNSLGEMGEKVQVWSNQDDGFISFPHPLLSVKDAEIIDLPAVILNSLQLALVHSYETKSLSPIAAYKRLVELGESQSWGVSFDDDALASERSEKDELKRWIKFGVKSHNDAPEPNDIRCGTPAMSAVERKQLALTYFEKEQAAFQNLVGTMFGLSRDSARDMPMIWELRVEVSRAYEQILSRINSTRA